MLAISVARQSVQRAVLRLIVDARDRQHVAGLLERDAVGDDAAHRAVRSFTVATPASTVIETEAGTVMGLVPILTSADSEVRGLPDITEHSPPSLALRARGRHQAVARRDDGHADAARPWASGRTSCRCEVRAWRRA